MVFFLYLQQSEFGGMMDSMYSFNIFWNNLQVEKQNSVDLLFLRTVGISECWNILDFSFFLD